MNPVSWRYIIFEKKVMMVSNQYGKTEGMPQWPVKPVRDCYHVYSDGTGRSVLYETRKDKVYGMNLIAIDAHICQVSVLCLVVEDTHFHLVCRGRRADILRYMDMLKEQTHRYFKSTGRPEYIGEGICISYGPIADDQELMRKIIYVMRNPVEAGYPYLPTEYHWGVGHIFFEDPENIVQEGIRLGSLSNRQMYKTMHTRASLPPEWRIDEEGRIDPRCYVDVDYVVKELFMTPKRFLAFMYVRKKDQVDIEMDLRMRDLSRHDDASLRDVAAEMAEACFGKDVGSLTPQERLVVARRLWGDYRVLSLKQLARVTRLTYPFIETVFGSQG